MFSKKTYVINQSGGGSGGGSDSLLIKDTGFNFTIGATETKAALSHAESFNINLTQAETNAALTEANKLTISGFSDTNAALTETKNTFLRAWAASSTDNDSSRTTPTNADGQNNGTTATIKTNLQVGDLTNPVILTSTFSGIPTTGTFSSKTIRVFYSIPTRTLTADTLTFKYNVGSGDVTFFTHSGTALVNNLTSGQTFDVSSLTLTQLQSIQLKATYLASVVAVPETQINLDSWAIELQGGI